MRPTRELLIALLLIASCHEEEEEEERDQLRENYWRVQIVVAGAGTVQTSSEVFDCVADGRAQVGMCGPTLVTFDELHPPLLRATAAPGWRFVRWESQVRSPFGFVRSRVGPMPDGMFYVDGFGYSDTGELETVRAVFSKR
ncbi:MAG: hypothetical protein ABI704_00500 [Kofleriaceae bacterium]